MSAPSGALVEVDRPRNIYIEPPPIDVGMGVEEAIYAAKVHEYNASTGRTLKKINLIEVFGTAAKEFHDTVGCNVCVCFFVVVIFVCFLESV